MNKILIQIFDDKSGTWKDKKCQNEEEFYKEAESLSENGDKIRVIHVLHEVERKVKLSISVDEAKILIDVLDQQIRRTNMDCTQSEKYRDLIAKIQETKGFLKESDLI